MRFAHGTQQLLILATEAVQAPVGAELIQHLLAGCPLVAGPRRSGSTYVTSHLHCTLVSRRAAKVGEESVPAGTPVP